MNFLDSLYIDFIHTYNTIIHNISILKNNIGHLLNATTSPNDTTVTEIMPVLTEQYISETKVSETTPPIQPTCSKTLFRSAVDFINEFHRQPIGKYTTYTEIVFVLFYIDWFFYDFSLFSLSQYINTFCVSVTGLLLWIGVDFFIYSFEKLSNYNYHFNHHSSSPSSPS